MSNIDADIKAKNDAIKKAALEKIKSKAFKVSDSFGKSTLFDITTHSPLDYTAGGMLAPRFVKNDAGTIEQKRVQGYMMPQEVSPDLRNIEFGGLTLMIRSEEQRKAHELYLAREADKVSGAVMRESEIVKKNPDKFVDFDTQETKKVIGAYK